MSEKFLFKSKKSSPEKEWKYKEYWKMRYEAEKNGDESFVYKNITYTRSLTPSAIPSNIREGEREKVFIYVRQQNL